MSHHVACTLPDGRGAIADYRQPVVHVLRRITAAYGSRQEPDPADCELVADWLDAHPEQACTQQQVRDGTCAHPPASPEEYRPPKYRPEPPVRDMQLALFKGAA